MLSLSPATRVFLATQPVDGRKGFNGLTVLVKEILQQEPTSGFLFVFLNKPRNRLKVLFWDGSGLILCTKRLEAGRPEMEPQLRLVSRTDTKAQVLIPVLAS